jgi:ABC-type multidrug transport system permease subunit
MRFVLTAALKDIRRRLADPAALAMWMGLPVVIGLLMSLLSSGGGPAIKAHLLVVDEDKSLLSGLVLSGGRQGQLGEMLEIELVTAAEGRTKIDAGDASALLTIPKGFQDGVLRDQPVALALVTNPAQRILPGIIEEGLKMLVEAAFYVQRLFGPEVRNVADTIGGGAGPSDDRVATISRAFNQRLRMLQDTLVPPLLSLETKAAASSAPEADFWSLFLPGLLFMALMFTAQGMSMDIWTEKMSGTLRRTLSTPQGAGAFLAGKLVAGLGIMAVAVLGTLVLGVTMFHVSLARAPIAFVWATFAGGALFCYFVLIQLLATSMRGGQFLSTMIVFPLIMMGGSFFPFEVMPAWMANIGRWTPNGLAVANVKQILFGRLDPAALGIAALAIGGVAVVAFVLGLRRLRGAFPIS